VTAALPIAMIYDSETTGIPAWNLPSEDLRQPHIVELAVILANREGVLERWSAIVKPEGWTIPADVAKIHGITTEKAFAEGRPAAEVYAEFHALWQRAAFRVAHSESFDAKMIRIAFKRHRPADADAWKAGKAYCTAALSEKICKLPPTQRMIEAGRGNQFKRPKLEEAYRALLGEEIPGVAGVHGALVDAEACLRIYTEIWRRSQT
jgi:DNA polymerase-3 subunit epsilon